MGTLHCFPAIQKKTSDPHFRDLLQPIPDFVRQLEACQKLAEGSLSAVLVRLETALADVDAIGRLLPPGEFKTQFDLDRSALVTQLDRAKGTMVGLREQTDRNGHSSL